MPTHYSTIWFIPKHALQCWSLISISVCLCITKEREVPQVIQMLPLTGDRQYPVDLSAPKTNISIYLKSSAIVVICFINAARTHKGHTWFFLKKIQQNLYIRCKFILLSYKSVMLWSLKKQPPPCFSAMKNKQFINSNNLFYSRLHECIFGPLSSWKLHFVIALPIPSGFASPPFFSFLLFRFLGR